MIDGHGPGAMLRFAMRFFSFASMLRFAMLLLVLSTATAQAQVTLGTASLTQDQVRAFYIARGFSTTAIAPYAQACVLSFEFRNAGPTALHFRLADWQTAEGIGFQPLADWDAAWETHGVSAAARTAFRWSQFPPEQEFEAGDWIMGMAALVRRPPGEFSLIARYHDDKGHHEIVVDRLSCARDSVGN